MICKFMADQRLASKRPQYLGLARKSTKSLVSVIGPGRFGYGIAAAGCRDYTVLENRIAPNTVFTGSMDVIPRVSPPTPFLRIDDGWAEGTFQSGFVTGPVRYLIGVQDGLGRSMQFHSGALDWKKGNYIHLRDVCFELATEGRLVVWDQHVHGRVLWSSPLPQDRPSPSISFEVTLDRKSGKLRIVTSGEEPKVLWDSMTFTDSAHYETRNKDPILVLQDSPPYLQVKDAGATLYATHSQWQHFELQADEFIAVSSPHGSSSNQRTPPPIPHETRPGSLRDRFASLHLPSAHPTPPNHSPPSRCTFLWMDPSSSQLVLHTSQHPRKPEEGDVIWRSPNWKRPASAVDNRSKATLQGWVDAY